MNQLSAQVSEKAAYSASVCSTMGYDSEECAGTQAEVADLRSQLAEAQQALAKCQAEHPISRLLQAEGHVTFLLINEPGGGYGGGATNWIDADVVFKLDSRPDKGFGFQLRDDPTQPVRRGMLDLLQDALVNTLHVITDYIEPTATPNNNCFVIRVALTPTPPSTGRPGDLPQAIG